VTISASEFRDWFSALQSLATIASFLVAGYWAWSRFLREDERYPRLQSSAEIKFIGKHGDDYVVEIVAVLENKGRVIYMLKKLDFDLKAILAGNPVTTGTQYGGQADFAHLVAKGSFLTARVKWCYVSPGVTNRYSWIAKVPGNARMLSLHCAFHCGDRSENDHTMEATLAIPPELLPATTV